jgi:peptidoglycan-associated lipoprotein
MLGKKLWIKVLGLFVVSAFVASCSKQLMPPEIESTGSVAESELEEVAEGFDATQGFAPEQDYPIDGSGSDESGFVGQESLADAGLDNGSSPGTYGGSANDFDGSGFVREENMTESGAVDSAPIISRESGSAGNGLNSNGGGTFNPFVSGSNENIASNGYGSGSGLGADQGIQEARLYSFRPTSELKDIHFKFDKYDLDSRSKSVLKQNADFLKQHPSVKVEIQGHCDERGTNNYNLALGQRRAASTKRYLASLGIPESRLHVISYGEEKPFCGETNEGCWERNRRAHFMVAE